MQNPVIGQLTVKYCPSYTNVQEISRENKALWNAHT